MCTKQTNTVRRGETGPGKPCKGSSNIRVTFTGPFDGHWGEGGQVLHSKAISFSRWQMGQVGQVGQNQLALVAKQVGRVGQQKVSRSIWLSQWTNIF